MKKGKSCHKLWEQRIASWRQSGKGASEWCRENNISATQLWCWRKIISPAITTAKNNTKASFTELEDSQNTSAGVEILVGDKVIRLHKNFDKATLESCLRLLGG